jgi:hypothetical protein
LDIGVGASESEDDDSPPKRKPLVAVPSSEEILTVFTRARDLQPDNPLYWRGVGDMLRHNEGALPSDEDDEIDAVYRRAAELARRDATLWYLLFNRELKKDFGEPNDPEGKKADRDKALFYLRQAQKADPANAWLHYEEAALQFRRTKHSLFTAPAALSQSPEAQVSREKYYGTLLEQDARDTGKQALAATIRANNIVNCFLPLYLPAVPKVFAAAWSYIGWQEELSNVFLWYARFRELARALTGYALFLVEQDKNLLEAVKACRAAVAIGQRLEGDWPIKDKHLGDDSAIRVLVGHALVGMGMKQWIIVEQIAGTPERAAAVQREYDAFQERVKRHKALVSKTIDNMNPVDYY